MVFPIGFAQVIITSVCLVVLCIVQFDTQFFILTCRVFACCSKRVKHVFIFGMLCPPFVCWIIVYVFSRRCQRVRHSQFRVSYVCIILWTMRHDCWGSDVVCICLLTPSSLSCSNLLFPFSIVIADFHGIHFVSFKLFPFALYRTFYVWSHNFQIAMLVFVCFDVCAIVFMRVHVDTRSLRPWLVNLICMSPLCCANYYYCYGIATHIIVSGLSFYNSFFKFSQMFTNFVGFLTG